MPTITRAALVAFLRHAATIPTNKVLPILQSICFRDGSIYKTNLNASVWAPIDHGGATFVLPEKALANFANSSPEGSISIEPFAKHIELRNDAGALLRLPLEDASAYPKPDHKSTRAVAIPAPFRWCLETGARFADPSHSQTAAWYINIINGHMYASDAMACIRTAAPPELNGAIIPKELAQAVARIPDAELVLAENEKQFFLYNKTNTLVYSFVKPEARQPDFEALMKAPVEGWVPIEKSGWVEFNETAIALASFYADCVVSNDMRLEMRENDTDITFTKTLGLDGATLPRFRYNAAILNKAIKAIPNNNININLTVKHKAFFAIPGMLVLMMGLADNA